MKGPDETPFSSSPCRRGPCRHAVSDQICSGPVGGGGGPQAQLLRRLAHWLMKEPALEAEQLSGRISGVVSTLPSQSATPHGNACEGDAARLKSFHAASQPCW